MRCSRCGAENREDRRFCAECGAALAASCPDCGFVNEAGEKFCGGCGKPLGQADRTRTDGSESAALTMTEGERRQVTVLFCDLAGYTRLTHELGAETVHALTDRFFALTDGLIERFGGTIDKHIGDCVMAVFGAPVAHGNDAERAVRAALARCGALALAMEDPAQRREILREGEALLAQGSVAHNHLRFYPDAMVTALELRDWKAVERYAKALEDFTRPEPLPWADFLIARGRALAAFGAGRRDQSIMEELERLRSDAIRIGFAASLAPIEDALRAR